MLPSTVALQIPGGPELVVFALILLPIVVLALIGLVLVRRLLALPDPSRVAELEREVVALREEVDELAESDDAAVDNEDNWGE